MISYYYWHRRSGSASLLHTKVHVAECDTDTTKRACRHVFLFMYARVHLFGSLCLVACSSVCISLCFKVTVCEMFLVASPGVQHGADSWHS